MAVLRSELKTVSKNEESHYIIKNFIRSEKVINLYINM